ISAAACALLGWGVDTNSAYHVGSPPIGLVAPPFRLRRSRGRRRYSSASLRAWPRWSPRGSRPKAIRAFSALVGGIVWTFFGKKQKQLRQRVDHSDHSPVDTAQTENERACHTGRDKNENHPAEKSSGVLQHPE